MLSLIEHWYRHLPVNLAEPFPPALLLAIPLDLLDGSGQLLAQALEQP